MKIIGNELRARVYMGAGYLDAMLGTKWRKRIDPEQLALDDGNACILGQVFGYYSAGRDELGLGDEECEDLGFFESSRSDDGDLDDRYKALDKEWKKYFKSQR